jgi:FdhD protein
MRTPGADRELAAGFLLSERVIDRSGDLGTIEHCANPADAESANIVDVTLADPARVERAFQGKRHVTTGSSCGMCGRTSIESLAIDVAPLTAAWTIGAEMVVPMPDRLRASQAVFDETGGLHAAGLFDADGCLIDAAEDVGRHNAVDKVIGRMLMRDALPLGNRVLFVSGRSSFEIVQKALLGGIPVIASVSAPSSLAIDLAAEMGITLVGFVRGDSFNIYTHPERIHSEP